jgi:hypothetical protein
MFQGHHMLTEPAGELLQVAVQGLGPVPQCQLTFTAAAWMYTYMGEFTHTACWQSLHWMSSSKTLLAAAATLILGKARRTHHSRKARKQMKLAEQTLASQCPAHSAPAGRRQLLT